VRFKPPECVPIAASPESARIPPAQSPPCPHRRDSRRVEWFYAEDNEIDGLPHLRELKPSFVEADADGPLTLDSNGRQ